MTELSERSEELAPKSEELKPAGEPVPQPEEKTGLKLSEPSKELATRVLTKVSFQERLIGYKMTPIWEI